MSSVVNKLLSTAFVLSSVLVLSGCSQTPQYENVAALKSAFILAGGVCDPSEVLESSKVTVGEAAVLKGMEGIACGGGIGIFTFPTIEARDYFLVQIERSAQQANSEVKLVVGDTWLIGGPKVDNEKFAKALGGTARY